MKTPEEWSAGQFLKGYRSLTDFVAAIQADAQQDMVPVEKVKAVLGALQEACYLYEKAYNESCECDKALPGGHCSFCNLFDKARDLRSKALQTAKEFGL